MIPGVSILLFLRRRVAPRFALMLLSVALVCASAAPVSAASRLLSLPSCLASPGMLVQIPVVLSDAAGLASVRVAINFDPQLLEFQSATSAALGTAFELTPSASDGVLLLLFTRETNLPTGAGRLAILSFRVNLGAEADAFSSVAVADFQVGDQSGILAMDALEPLLTQNGRVTVNASPFLDNDGDGLPDRWETSQGLSMLDADTLADPDGDGMANLMEYALGLDPLNGAQTSKHPVSDVVETGASRYLSLTFRRLLAPAPGLVYMVEESTDLTNWSPLDPALHQIGAAGPQGDGSELVTIRGTIPLEGPEAQTKAFMHLRVGRPAP